MENAEAIRNSGDIELLNEVNSTIHSGRRRHARASLRLDTLLQEHDDILQHRADAWHKKRERQLRNEDSETVDVLGAHTTGYRLGRSMGNGNRST